MLMGPAINPALQFIHTAGVSGFVSGVRMGMIAPAQALAGFRAVGQAVDTYVEVNPAAPLADLRTSIGSLPKRDVGPELQEDILGQLITHQGSVERVVQMFEMGAAATISAPFDLDAQWRWIPAGVFQMGSANDDPHADGDEKPLMSVMVGGFYMLDHPVTNAEFRAFLKAVGREDVRYLDRKFAGDFQPAVRVDHKNATAYSRWLGEEMAEHMMVPVIGGLPPDAEWEKAAKGPDGTEFISPATREQAHFYAKTTRVVNHPDAYANGYGLKDMIGNVCEWTARLWREEGALLFGCRGGAGYYSADPSYLRAACRHRARWSYLGNNFGFRPVLVPALSPSTPEHSAP